MQNTETTNEGQKEKAEGSYIRNSEAAGTLTKLAQQYRDFCFRAISKVKYPPVRQWIAFADGRLEDALKEKRTVTQNIKDTYVLAAVGLVLCIIGFWYFALLFLFVGGIFTSLGLAAVWLAARVNLPLVIAGALATILVALLMPGIFFLLKSGIYHLVAKALGGKGRFSDTMTLMVMANATQIIFMIPIYLAYAVLVGYLIGPVTYVIIAVAIYRLYKGIKLVHGITSTKRAVIATILPWLIYLVVVVCICIAGYIAFIYGLVGAAGMLIK